MAGLRIKPHFSVHVLSADEVALLGENGRFALHGKVYAALVPLLDGCRDADDLAALLQDSFRPELVHYALARLEGNGYAETDDAAGGEIHERAWWSAHDVAAARRQSGVSRAVHLVDAGAYPPAFTSLRHGIARHRTLRQTARADVVTLIATGDYLDPRLSEAVRDVLAEGGMVLPARLAGMALWLGPLIDREGVERFTILLRRLADNRPADLAALRLGARFPLLPPQGLPESFELAASWIGCALTAIAAGTPPPSLIEGVLTIDPATLETSRHPIVIRGPSAPIAPPEAGYWALQSGASPKGYTADGGHRTCPPHETLARLEPFIGPIAGIVPEIQKLSTPEGMHVYYATQIFGGARPRSCANRVLGRPSDAAGKGATDLQAKVSCLAEAVERYSCGHFGDEPRRLARVDDFDSSAVDPNRLLHYSEAQYRDRETINAARGFGSNWVPVAFDRRREIEWTPAWSLTSLCRRWLPTAYCYYNYPLPADHQFCRADSNGCAAGNTLREAILQGFFELVERDACALWWYNRIRRPGIDLASFDDRFFDAMDALFNSHGRELIALDLTADLGIPVVAAISWRRRDGGRVHIGLGSHLDPRLAISRALAELNQGAGFDLRTEGEQDEALEPDHRRWLAEATVESQPYLRPGPASLKRASDFQDHSTRDLVDDLRWCVERMRACGLELIVLDHTRRDIGFPVVRVLVPGLRHFWQRLAPGRLYDVPQKLGWVERPLREDELNPIPIFF